MGSIEFEIFFSISGILALCYAMLLFFFISGWNNSDIYQSNQQTNTALTTQVSILIVARNEEANILACLQHLIVQSYNRLLIEIIIVDDNSSDATKLIVENFIRENKGYKINLIVLQEIENNFSPKKRALEIAIEKASGSLIITLDADCIMNSNWLQAIVSFSEQNAPKMIVSPIQLKTNQTYLLEFQKYELMSLVASGAASLYFNKPLLCNGANLAFEKSTYISCKDEMSGKNHASGDDMFLMLAIKNKFPNSIKFLKSKEAIVQTGGQENYQGLIAQRKRWISKGFAYHDTFIYGVSLLVFLVNFFLLTTAVISFFNIQFSLSFLLLFLTKVSFDYFFLLKTADFFEEKINWRKVVLFSLLYPLFVTFIAAVSLKKSYTWKERKLN